MSGYVLRLIEDILIVAESATLPPRSRVVYVVDDEASSRQPGEPWFERGADPVLALASSDAPSRAARQVHTRRSQMQST